MAHDPHPVPGELKVHCTLRDVVRRQTLVTVQFRSLDDSTKELNLRMQDFWSPQAFARTLIAAEFPLPSNPDDVARLRDDLKRQVQQMAADPSRRVEATPLQGWHGRAVFILGNRTVPEGAKVVFLPTAGIAYPRVAKAGRPEAWCDRVAAVLPCSSRMLMAVCAAYSAALLPAWRGPIAGVGFNLSGQSRGGKTSALRVAQSTFGDPRIEGWNASRAGIAQRLMGHRHFLMICDETAAARPSIRDNTPIVEQVTDLIAGGQPDRLHPGALGELEKAGVGFECVLLSSTEGTLAMRRRGQQARLIEVPLPLNGFGIIDHPELCGPPVSDVAAAGRWIETVVEAAANHYGHAFPMFVQGLVELRKPLENIVQAHVDTFRAQTPEADSDAWSRSVRDTFALLFAAGALAREFGILPIGMDILVDRLRCCLRDALALAAAPAATAIEHAEHDAKAIRKWLHENWSSRAKFGSKRLTADAIKKHRVIGVTDPEGKWCYLVRKKALASAVPEQNRMDVALQLIAARGGLLPDVAGGKLTRQKRLSGGTKARFLHFERKFARPT